MIKTSYKAILVSLSGVRVYNPRFMELGLTLPGFVDRSKVIASLPSLGLLSLAAYTPKNWEVVYKEMDNWDESILNNLIKEKPDVVALSALTPRIHEAYKLTGLLRKEGITVILGGLYASAVPEEALNHADVVVQGEGELIWPQLLQDFENNELLPFYSSLKTPEYVCKLDSYRVPRYDLLDIKKYNRLTLQTTRGCPLHCSFCAASRTISTYKKKPIERIEAELQAILNIWPRPFIELADDNTFVDKKWSKELLKLFGKYPLKWFTETDISVADDDELLELLQASGCAQVLIGFESTTPKALKGLDRNDWKLKQFDRYHEAIDKIQSYGISVNGCFIIGFDTDTVDTFEATENFIKQSNLSEVQLTLLTPFPGTDLHNSLKAQNRLMEKNLWEKCTLFDLTFQPKNMTFGELEDGFAQLMQKVYAPTEVERRQSNFRKTIQNKRKRILV